MPHMDRLFRHAMWLERNRSNAEDLVQETLIQAMESFRRFVPGTNCRAWLLSILHHVHLNRLRKQGRVIVDSELEERNFTTRMLLQVHDELIFEGPKAELDDLRELLLRIMPASFSLNVPLKVDLKVGKNWADME